MSKYLRDTKERLMILSDLPLLINSVVTLSAKFLPLSLRTAGTVNVISQSFLSVCLSLSSGAPRTRMYATHTHLLDYLLGNVCIVVCSLG